jgi:uncharacterized membrane protein YbaN (DUF454 family)
MNRFLKILYIILGTICIVLGTLGVFIPGLPVTPFLLLASSLYLRSSDKLYNKLISNKLLGKYIVRYRQNKGMTIKTKIYSIIVMWFMIALSTLFLIEKVEIKLIVTAVGIIGSIVMGLVIKTVKLNNSKS